MLYFLIALSPDTSTWAAWQAPIIPVVDFNGDGHVNGKDVVVLTEHWGESDSVCDIGPYAWGDGIVDEQDLFALAEYLEEEFVDPTLTAHWALDEAEGPVASDSAGENDAMVMGDPVWQPDAGVFGGALAFDGVDDFVLIPALPRLGDGPFSILAWVKGGTPGEVVISHTGGADWLYTNPLDGTLMTGLSEPGRNATALFCDAVITDGQWHRIGLVWDGTSRILLVDEQEVARDEEAELAIPEGSLMIGTAGAATPGRYFTGLIDDVRIHRRVVKP
jgi:sialidase-1